MTLTDDQAAITCIAGEAANQPHEGRVAVGIVILNRAMLPYASDGTVRGAVEHRWAFSEFWAAMTHGQYLALPAAQQGEPEAEKLFGIYSSEKATWDACAIAWSDAQAWHAGKMMSFTPGPAFAGLTKHTVLYYNPAIVKTPPLWAIPENQDAVIFAETFFHDPGH